MKRRRWLLAAAVAAGVVALVAPAVGQGKSERASLKWSLSRGGSAITSADFGTVDGRPRVSRWFRLGNSSSTKSGKLAIALTGSSAYSITDNRCTGKSIGRGLSCWVRVTYVPFGAPPSGSATLVATGHHGSFAHRGASLSLSEKCSDTAAHHVYWGSSGGVMRVPVGGGCVTTLASDSSADDYEVGYPISLAVDSTHVYWVDLVGGAVNEVPIGGGSVTTLATGQDSPVSVAVDGTNVYWVNHGHYPNYDGTVNEVPIGGGPVVTLATGQSLPASVAVDGTHVYWVNSGGYSYTSTSGTVNAVPVGGGPVSTLASGQSFPNSVAVDGTHVYWTNAGVNTVNEVPLGGGSVTTLADGQFGVVAVAVDGTNVYWGNYGSRTVSKAPLGGGDANALAGGAFAPTSLAVDGKTVYWASANLDPNSPGGAVSQVPISGYPTTTLARGDWKAEAVAIGP